VLTLLQSVLFVGGAHSKDNDDLKRINAFDLLPNHNDLSDKDQLRRSSLHMNKHLDEAELALKTGHWDVANRMLSGFLVDVDGNGNALDSDQIIDSDKRRAIRGIADLYWHTGQYAKLDALGERYMGTQLRHYWKCRTLDKTVSIGDATKCWNAVGEIDRTKRNIREGVLNSVYLGQSYNPYTLETSIGLIE
jgi:hypothetical protein